eukprot:5727544-Amphidinium_carterae.1
MSFAIVEELPERPRSVGYQRPRSVADVRPLSRGGTAAIRPRSREGTGSRRISSCPKPRIYPHPSPIP